MRGPRPVWLIAALGAALLAVAVGAHALEGLGGPLASGGSHYVEVVQTDGSGVIAGLVTETDEGPIGFTSEQRTVETGWMLVHPEDTEPADELTVVDELAFEDPNGGEWMQRQVELDGTTAWVVPVDEARHDPTLDAPYNFAVVVDWDEVPEDQDLTTTYVDSVELVR